MSELSPPRIVCAACRYPDGFIVCAPRHGDPLMRDLTPALYKHQHYMAEQGFIDQHRRFYSRTRAWKIAEANGQIRRRCGGDDTDGGTLFSENLY